MADLRCRLRTWLAAVVLLALPSLGAAQSSQPQPQQTPAETSTNARPAGAPTETAPSETAPLKANDGSNQPPGDAKSTITRALELGSKMLQGDGPLGPMDVYLVGFHPMKDDPEHQMEAHHFCHQVNEDFAQCVLFDGNGKGANLNGIEYIISEKIFETLPEEERAFWHPHNGEILSGQLTAPGVPAPAEKELMKRKMNSYGKTWHVWNTGTREHTGDRLPLGEARLAWSFSRDGEIRPSLLQQRDRAMDMDTRRIREDRADLTELAKPQSGVDALQGKFERSTTPIPGVADKNAAARPQ